MKHTLSILVQNQAGVLSRVAALFTRRGYNIESIAVGPTEDPRVARMTIVVEGDSREVEQITKHVHKLIEVLKVTDLTHEDMVDRELALINEVTGDEGKIEAMIRLLRPHGIKELARTGRIALARGARPEPASRGVSATA